MKVPQYENQVAPGQISVARPQVATPVSGAFGEKLAQAGANMAQGVAAIARESEASARRFEVRNRNLRLTSAQLNWQKDNDEILNGKIGPDGKRIDGGLLAKQYNDADGIAEAYSSRQKELMDKHLSTAANPEEYEELRLYFEKDFQNNYNRVAQHQLKEQRATDDLLTKAFTEDAMQRVAANPETLNEQLGLMTEKAKANWMQNGLPPEVQEANLYALNGQAVSTAVGTLLERDQPAQAAEVLTANRDKIDVKTGRALAKQVKTAVVNNLKTDLWAEASKVRTATGEVDLSYAKRVIAATGYEQSIQDDLLKDLEARMSDEKHFKEQQNRTRDENFYSAADKLVSSGGSLEQGLKLAGQFANDSKDKFTKEKFIESLFKEYQNRGRAAQSDPEEYLRLWKGIHDGSVTEDDVKNSFNAQLLSATDYKGLVKDIYKSPEEKQATNLALKQIEAQAYKTIPDTEDRRIFMLEVRRQSEGKTVPEMFAIAKDLQSKQGGFLFMGGTPKYQVSAERNEQQNRVLGAYMLSENGNLSTFNAFTKYAQQTHPQGYEWTKDDWEKFQESYPGIEKPGTPENRALVSLLAAGQIIDDENLAAAIDIAYEHVGQKSTRQLEREQKDKKAKESAAALKKQMELFNKLAPFKAPVDLIPRLADESKKGQQSPWPLQ
ncbi:hypothetical protein [Candidatus Avelusimicrobium fimicolum]|uniref:hypothetical protein n=1 Tax=Candidatus Avelusimicrobium fimicolum TaxID=3416216 RepID=UPI003D0B76D9